MKLEKGITILCNSVDEFERCCKHFNIIDFHLPFWEAGFGIFRTQDRDRNKYGKPIIYDDAYNMYGWCSNCIDCKGVFCESKDNERITYSEYKNMIRFNKLNRILKNEK